jgi:hypothetical protein
MKINILLDKLNLTKITTLIKNGLKLTTIIHSNTISQLH